MIRAVDALVRRERGIPNGSGRRWPTKQSIS
jgi:hypothetical protein